jgi:hypothetical protein
MHNSESRTQSPESRIQDPESRIRNPGSIILPNRFVQVICSFVEQMNK